MACEAICQKPKKSEDATIFDLIFGHPLVTPNAHKEMSKQVRRNDNDFLELYIYIYIPRYIRNYKQSNYFNLF